MQLRARTSPMVRRHRSDKQKRPSKDERSKLHIVFETLASGSSCDLLDFAAINTEVVQFTITHAAQFGDRLTVLAPIVKRACDVHDNPLSLVFEVSCQSLALRLLRYRPYMIGRTNIAARRLDLSYALIAYQVRVKCRELYGWFLQRSYRTPHAPGFRRALKQRTQTCPKVDV